MRDVFLSYRYDDANEELARKAEALLESHSLRAVTGDVLGGRGWTTHPFCLDELKHARSKGRPAIALLEGGGRDRRFPSRREVRRNVGAHPALRGEGLDSL